MKTKIVVFGCGEFGSLVENIIFYNKEIHIAAFGDDNIAEEHLCRELPVYGMDDLIKFSKNNNINSAICAIGNNQIRSEKYNYMSSKGFDMLSIIHPKAMIDTKVSYGKNVIIEMGTAIHTNSTIGDNVFLGGDALIGHHNLIGNHVLIGGNVSLGGSVKIEDFVSIGVGASVKPGVKIGKGATIGVGAAVIKDVDAFTTVVGVPARPINLK